MTLVIRDLSKEYNNGVKALNRLSLNIGVGMFGLLGPNGAGKSTLMRTIATLQNPDSGEIYFDDLNVLENPMGLRRILGYLPQSFGVYKRESADNLLNYMAILKGISDRKQRNELIEYALHITNLTDVRRKHVSSYSGGMKQRFGIAQLLLNNPKLIIVDEPTAGLDPEERNRFLNILREIGTENTVIFSTHIVEDIKELCTDMAIMNDGEICLHTSPQKACETYKGKLWLKDIKKEKLEDYQRDFQVLSSSFNSDNTIRVRVYADENPGNGFHEAELSLEDVYFSTLRKYNHAKLVKSLV